MEDSIIIINNNDDELFNKITPFSDKTFASAKSYTTTFRPCLEVVIMELWFEMIVISTLKAVTQAKN